MSRKCTNLRSIIKGIVRFSMICTAASLRFPNPEPQKEEHKSGWSRGLLGRSWAPGAIVDTERCGFRDAPVTSELSMLIWPMMTKERPVRATHQESCCWTGACGIHRSEWPLLSGSEGSKSMESMQAKTCDFRGFQFHPSN